MRALLIMVGLSGLLLFSCSLQAAKDSLLLHAKTLNTLQIHPKPMNVPAYWQQLHDQNTQFSAREWSAAERWVGEYLEFAGGKIDSIPTSTNGASVGGLLDHEIQTIQRARAVISHIKTAGNFLSKLTGQDLVQLPIGLSQEVANVRYTMGIASMQLHAQYAQLEVFLEIDAPNLAMPLLFSSPDVKFSASGGIVGGATLTLLGNIPIEIVPNRSALILMRGMKDNQGAIDGGTFVTIDCDGFSELGLDAVIEFSRAWLKPANDNGSTKVSGRVATIISDWDDMLLEVDLDDFVINKMEDVIWRVDRAVFDFSDWRNANGIEFPLNGYDPPLSDERWRGFYIEEFHVELPQHFSGADSTLLIQGNDIIIDDMGFTGSAMATPILPLEQGELGGWAFSIDTFGISVIANQVESVAFNGLLNIPLAQSNTNTGDESSAIKREDCLQYQAYVNTNNEYFFSVSPNSTFAVDIWQAEVGFDSCSYIDIFDLEEGFTVKANLHGYATIKNGEGSGTPIQADSIHFQAVQLSNRNPYFKPGYWSFPSVSPNFGAFAMTLENIGLYPGDEHGEAIALGFDALISLSPSNSLGITACGGFAFQGELRQENGRQRWAYKGMKVNDIFVNVSAPGFGVNGGLSFYKDDPTFGNGFRGMVSAWFRGVNDPGSTEAVAPPEDLETNNNSTSCFGEVPDAAWGITAMGQFGSIDGFDYFIVDALVHLGEGIPILSEALKLKSFGGGVYHRMARQEDSFAALEEAEENLDRVIPPLGSSLTGIQYYPDRNAGIGIKATVLLAGKKEKAFNANATFEIIFNNSGGLTQISFYGTAKFMQDIAIEHPYFEENPNIKPPVLASMSAYVSLDLNFEEWELDANMAVFINAGAGVVRGAGDNDKMGWANLYLSKNNGWHLKAGEPAPGKRNGVIIGIPKIAENLVRLQCYLMMGTHEIPGIPPIESDLMARIMQYDKNQSHLSNRPSAVSQGGGFAFGASLDINTGERNFLIFYGHFALALGFDVAIQDFGEARCANGGAIGINGWYASGQAWAGIGAGVGIKVRLFGRPRKFEIASVAAGAILQAKLPNPFWAKGSIGAHYNILNGLIKGNWKFDITIGQECEIIGAEDPGLVQVIEGIDPSQGLDAVDVSTTPKVNFLVPVEEAYSFTNIEGERETYRVRIDQEATYILAGGKKIQGTIQVAEDHLSAQFIPNRILAGETDTRFIVSVFFEEKSGNSWQKVKENNEVVIEKDTLDFKTGPGLDHIPNSNILANYPIDGQYNFYKKENELGKGYILLARAQPDLLLDLPANYKQAIRLTKSQEVFPSLFDFTVDEDGKSIAFNLPPDALEADQVYKLELIQYPDQAIENADLLYQLFFRVSRYNTLQEKLAELPDLRMAGRGGIIATAAVGEAFGPYELGWGAQKGLIELVADMSLPWYQQEVIDVMYNDFPVTVNGCVNTQTISLAPPPYGEDIAQAIHFGQNGAVPLVSKTHFDDPTQLPMTGPIDININYLVPQVLQQQYDELYANAEAILTQAMAYFDTDTPGVFAGGLVNDFTTGDSSGENDDPPSYEELRQLCPSVIPVIDFCSQSILPLSNGNYPLKLKYRFPGTTSIGTQMVLQLLKDDNR